MKTNLFRPGLLAVFAACCMPLFASPPPDVNRAPEGPRFERKGVTADRTGCVVRVTARSIRLNPGDAVEFPLITAASGKDYEALAVTGASARDIHDALVFIGLKPGRPTDPSALRFWPKGDRVRMLFHYPDPASGKELQVPAERLILDTRTKATLPEDGFVFTGSAWIPSPSDPATRQYAADAYTPNCVVAAYNESTAVLDVPRRAAQHEVYSYLVPNPDFPLPSNQVIQITFSPFFTDGRMHERDLTLAVRPMAGATNAPGDPALEYRLTDATGAALTTNLSLNGFLSAIGHQTEQAVTPFLTFIPGADLPLAVLQKLAGLLLSLDTDRGLRLEPPASGDPYLQAFAPNEQHRQREARPVPGTELHLAQTPAGPTGALVFVEAIWKDDDAAPTFRETSVPVRSAADIAPALENRDIPAVFLVFAPRELPYGDLKPFLQPPLARKMIVYVFLTPERRSPASPPMEAP